MISRTVNTSTTNICLVDTYILLRLVSKTDPDRPLTQSAILKLTTSGAKVAICPQNIVELRVVLTRPVEVNGFGFDATAATSHIAQVLKTFLMLPESPNVFTAWKMIVEQYGTLGKQNHDARLLAAAQVAGCTSLMTFNDTHFKRYTATIPVAIINPVNV